VKLTAPLAQALANLRASADFKVLLEALKEDEKAELKHCVVLDGVALHRSQGKVQVLQEIEAQYLAAPVALTKLKG
jgi:hypothetical protein